MHDQNSSALSRRSLLLGTTAAAAIVGGVVPGRGLSTAAAAVVAPAVPRFAIWGNAAAGDWESQAYPIGNGRLGAMLFGGVAEDRLQLNEISLWGGLNGYDNALAGQGDGAYDTHVNAFGSYRAFGDLIVTLGVGGNVVSGSSGGTDSTSSESVTQSYDGNVGTKWCIIAPNGGSSAWNVTWQARMGRPAVVTGYSLTSANDVPERDPQNWTVAGSQDGSTWTTLDTKNNASTPFTARGQKLTFSFSNSTAYSYYRLQFAPKVGVTHWQVAEIGLTDITLGGSGGSAANYKRALDLTTGVHTTSFSQGGGTQVREAFASRTGDLLVIRYTTDAPGGMSGSIALTSAQTGQTPGDTAADQPKVAPQYSVTADGSHLRFTGELGNSLKHAADAEVRRVGGTLAPSGNKVNFSGCSTIELRLDLRTNYQLSAAAGWRTQTAPAAAAAATLQAVSGKTFDQLKSEHVAAFSAVMNRVQVDWGTTDAAVVAMTTQARRERYAADVNNADPDLEKISFLFSRYLLASSSRSNGLPANLQGLWNNLNQPPWASDYHSNINLQMNYWGAETTDLGDSHLALINWLEQVAIPSRVATKNAFGANTRGWTARTSQSAFGGNSWEWNTVASAWYMQHVYEHWAFNPKDTAYLQRAYPMVKEICEFWQDRLVERTIDGKAVLVSPMGWSPEHGPREDGVMYDQQIIWDLFTNYLALAKALNVDAAYQTTVTNLRSRLAPNKIGSWGQLQEWQTDRDSQTDLHRHTSHLFAVYPGRQILKGANPALSAAALKSLNARCGVPGGETIGVDTVSGDSRRSWTWPWRTALFARLAEPERAYMMVRGLLKHNTLANFYATHPPFQIDGNLGISGGITEMLVQSHEGYVSILPAIPQRWRAKGSFSGLRARGGFRVSAAWENGVVTSYSVVADRATSTAVTIKVNGQTIQQP